LYSLRGGYHRFRGNIYLHLQGRNTHNTIWWHNTEDHSLNSVKHSYLRKLYFDTEYLINTG
jgi:hypothetical protein